MKRFVLYMFLVVCVQKVTLSLAGHRDIHKVVTDPTHNPVTVSEVFHINGEDWEVTKVEAACKTFKETPEPKPLTKAAKHGK